MQNKTGTAHGSHDDTADTVTCLSAWRPVAPPARGMAVSGRRTSSSHVRSRSRSRSRTRDQSQQKSQEHAHALVHLSSLPSLTGGSSQTETPPDASSSSLTDVSSLATTQVCQYKPSPLVASAARAPDDEIGALKGRLQYDINQAFAWKQGMTNRLDGINNKVNGAWAAANEGVQRAKDADKRAGAASKQADEALSRAKDADKRSEDALKESTEAMRRAKNVYNTCVNEQGPKLRQIKERVIDLEKKVDDLQRDTRSMSRTLIDGAGASSESSGGGGSHGGRSSEVVTELRADVRYLLREVDDLRASHLGHTDRLADLESAHEKTKGQLALLVQLVTQENAKVDYLMQRIHPPSFPPPPPLPPLLPPLMTPPPPQQQQQQRPVLPAYAYALSHPPASSVTAAAAAAASSSFSSSSSSSSPAVPLASHASAYYPA